MFRHKAKTEQKIKMGAMGDYVSEMNVLQQKLGAVGDRTIELAKKLPPIQARLDGSGEEVTKEELLELFVEIMQNQLEKDKIYSKMFQLMRDNVDIRLS